MQSFNILFEQIYKMQCHSHKRLKNLFYAEKILIWEQYIIREFGNC